MAAYPPNKLVSSIASESLSDVLTIIADTSLDATIRSGTLNAIPVIGIVTGLLKAARDVREAFLLHKLAVFLQETSKLSFEERNAFKQKFSNKDAQEDFGGALLVLIDRSEDMEKPRILGRLLAAHVQGVFSKKELMRLSKMVDRCYFEDLAILKSFKSGVQPDNEIPAQSLAAQGFLYQAGMDSGGFKGSNSGILYQITNYGEWLAKYGLEG